MKWILGVFAMTWNRIHGSWGHFWGDRFFSRILDGLSDYLRTLAYVEENPVRAGLVGSPEEWAWGSASLRRRGLSTVLDPGGPFEA